MEVSDTHVLNKKEEQGDEYNAILQYLWERLRDKIRPCSSADCSCADSDRSSLNVW